MAIQINSLMGVTLLRANRVLTVEDAEHESEIEKGSIFGIRQIKKRFYILDIGVRPLEIYAFEVSKTQYLRYAAQGTLLTEKDLPKFIPSREIRKAFKPMLNGDPLTSGAPRDAQFFDSELMRLLVSTFDNVPAIGFQLDDNRDMTRTPANVLNVKIAYDDDAETIRKFVRERISLILRSPSIYTVIVEPKVLKKDSDIVAVTGAGIIKLVEVPDVYGLVRKGKFSPSSDIISLQNTDKRANVSEMKLLNRLNAQAFKGTDGITMDKDSGKLHLAVPKSKSKKVLSEFSSNMVRNSYELLSGTDFEGNTILTVLDKDNPPARLEINLGSGIITDMDVRNIIEENGLLAAVYEDYIKQDVPIVSKNFESNTIVLDGSNFTLDEIKAGAFMRYPEDMAEHAEDQREWQDITVGRDGSVSGIFWEGEYSEQGLTPIELKFVNVR